MAAAEGMKAVGMTVAITLRAVIVEVTVVVMREAVVVMETVVMKMAVMAEVVAIALLLERGWHWCGQLKGRW